jgi:hypothetical protein
VGFCLHRPALAFHGGNASRLLAQPALRAEPVFLSSSRGDSWDASRQIARHMACLISHPHDTSPRNWRSLMGSHGASAGSSSHRSLARFRPSPRVLRRVWGFAGFEVRLCETSPAASRWAGSKSNPIGYCLAVREPACCLLGTCAVSGLDPMWPAQCASGQSYRFDFRITTIITPRVVMWTILRTSAARPVDSSHDPLRLPQRSHTMWGVVAETSGVTPFFTCL